LALIERVSEPLSVLRGVPGLELALRSSNGLVYNLFNLSEQPEFADAHTARFPIKASTVNCELLLQDSGADRTVLKLAEIAIGSVIEQIAMEHREELLLDELGSNWESLEAIYEISTDLFRFADVHLALERLLNRLAAFQDGLDAAVFLSRNGLLEPVAVTVDDIAPIPWASLGPLQASLLEGRAVVVNHKDPNFSFRGAARLAAAPVTANSNTIGALVAWRADERVEFNAPFLRLLEAMTYQASMLLESDRLNRTTRENERLAQEIEIASSIQQTLLLGNAPIDTVGIDIACFSAASNRIDGDFYDFLRHSPACVDVLIGDVMGKGVAAALLGAASKSQFLRAVTNLAVGRPSAPSPENIVRRAASRLSNQLIALDRFVTICYARFDLDRGMVDFVDCGHTGLILFRRDGGAIFLRGDDLPIGVLPDFDCTGHSHDLRPGDSFLLFSDGITEARDANGEFFGEERLVECIETWSSLGPRIFLDQLRRAIREFTGGAPPGDDCTGIAISIPLDESGGALAKARERFTCDVSELARMREWVTGYADREGNFEAHDLARLELISTEIFVNCAHHGAPGGLASDGRREPVDVTMDIFARHVKVEFRHAGPQFDPLAAPEPAFDGSRERGFGNYIVFRSADALKYAREGDKNIIVVSVLKTSESDSV
jgi:serine phosphatase RsbU (regulator of sigma subunit)/anti-sigma regulatory factor (Ser/Thr protein kinase)